MTRIGFTGDVMLGRLVDESHRRQSATAVWGDLTGRLSALDALIVNLECCLSTRGTQWRRTRRAFHFRADPDWAIPALNAVDVSCCALANNHVFDYEEPALLETLSALDDAGIAHAGAGRNRRGAFAPVMVPIGDLDVGFFSVTDNTPEYAATPARPGTAHVDIEPGHTDVTSVLDALSVTGPDLVVASLHWGPNMRTDPPTHFQAFAHWLVDAGVDVVHGHSAHVFQGVEDYGDGVILYDCGDFVDDYAVDRSLHNDRGFLFELDVEDGSPRKLRLVPTEIQDKTVHHASGAVARWCRDTMCDRSQQFDTRFERDGDKLVLAVA